MYREDGTKINCAAEAAAIRATGAAKAEAYKLGRESLGEAGYVATQMASNLGENRV